MLNLLIIFFLSIQSSQAEISAPTIQLCPHENTLLDESYPAKAIVISDIANKGYEQEKLDLLKIFIPEVLQNSDAKILLISKKKNFDSLTKPLSEDQKRRVLKLSHASKTNWMQDPWVIQFDDKTGNPLARPLLKYKGSDFDSGKLANAVANILKPDLTMKIGAGLDIPENTVALGGQYGGNFLALGNLCLVGSSNLKDKFAEVSQQVCGKNANIIKVPTSFLNVGHADEVINAVPDRKAQDNATCPLAVLIASPRKAKKLMEENPEDLVFDFRDNTQKPLDKKSAIIQLEDRRYYRMLCMRLMGLRKKKIATGWRDDSFAIESEPQDINLSPCLALKNKDFIRFYKDHTDYEKAMNHIQERMDEFTKDLSAQYKKKNPKCALKIVEAPQYFAGKIQQEIRHGFSPRMMASQSLFPNPSNGEAFGEKYILPDPVNASFRNDLNKSLSELGLSPVYLNTHFAHRLQGNLHCSEKTLRICRANK